MGSHRLVWGFFKLLVIIVPFSGCQTLHPTAPVDVQVRDAETQAHIAGAQVRAWRTAVHSVTTAGTTGPDGQAQIPTPPGEGSLLQFEATAQGYLPKPAGQAIVRSPTGVILEMYAEPRPVLELVVPTGYRGIVKTTFRVQNDLKFEPRQRLFSFPVPASGVVAVVVPPIFTPGMTPNIRTRYADGTMLPRDAKDFELGCRWLKADPESEHIFVIGTQWEADEIRRAMKKADSGRNAVGEESVTGFGRLR